jgi:uncharacterized small protein (DUF1192 family)
MDLDDLLPKKKPESLLAALAREDLEPLSVEDLTERIAALEAEVARSRARLSTAGGRRAAAEALFKK